MKCALCSYEYDERALACHSQCPMSDGCAIICCPNCGYQAVDETKAWGARLLRRLFLRGAPQAQSGAARAATVSSLRPGLVPLSRLAPGASAEVADLATTDADRLMRLSTLGIVPGCRLRLEQRWPVCIISVGETQLSLDTALAGEILMRAPQ